jgi:CRISPR-associated endoribonuclease Cas6
MFFELRATVVVKQSVHHLSMQQHIGSWINRAQLSDEQFKRSHYEKAYKHYVFSNLYPLEKDSIYQKGRAYVLTIRSSIENTLTRINSCLQSCREDDYFLLVSCEQRSRRLPPITEMITITPAIVTIDDHQPWLPENNIELLLKQLHANAEKKFKHLNPHSQLSGFQPFIQGIRVENRKPIATAYKGRKLLGNKLRLFINEDQYSQKLANAVLGSGLSEKNSTVGAGFCLAKCLN